MFLVTAADVLPGLSLVAAALPTGLFLKNLGEYRPPRATLDLASSPKSLPEQTVTSSRALEPPAASELLNAVSILIPARNEAAGIATTLQAALKTRGIRFEIVVLDDHSTDGTAEIVGELAAVHPELRLEQAPPLPAGWCGKQHACWILSQRARYNHWIFLDADVRLMPDGAAAAVRFLQDSQAGLVSGIPRQETGTFLEGLLIPLIHWVLLGFLPLQQMRTDRRPAFGAGCGQFFVTHRAAYEQAGGHATIRESLHDGVRLPRAFRKAGLLTDLFDATESATCRMYRSSWQTWQGLSKNATEGIAKPGMLPPVTVVLLLGQVLPFVLLAQRLTALGRAGWQSSGSVADWSLAVVGLAALLAWLPRLVAVGRFHQPLWSAVLHPVGIAVFLTLQWMALFRKQLGRPATWRDRSYSPTSA